MVIRVGDKRRLINFLVQGLDRRVFSPFKFVAHDSHFRAPVFFAQQQIAHAVRFHVKHRSQVFAAQIFIVVGAVHPGGGVVAGTRAFKQLVNVIALAAVALACPLEHQVFQNVGRASAARHLIFGANPVGHHQGQGRAGMLGQQQDLQAIRLQRVFVNAADRLHMGKTVPSNRVRLQRQGRQQESNKRKKQAHDEI